MHLNQEPVGSDRDRTTAQNFYEVGSPTSLTWVDDDGEVRFLFGDRNGCQIQRVTRISLKRSYASLAEQDVWIALRKNIFGGQEPFLDPFAHSALQQNRLLTSGTLDQELEILGVSRTDLQDVCRVRNVLYVPLAKHLGDDFQPGFLLREVQQAQPFASETLKFVGRSSRLVGTSPQNLGSTCSDGSCGGQKLVFGFDAAGTCHDDEGISSYENSIDVDDGIFGPGFPANQFVAFLDGQNAFDLRKNRKRLKRMVSSFISNCCNDCLQLAMDWVGSVSQLLDLLDYFRNLFLCRS